MSDGRPHARRTARTYRPSENQSPQISQIPAENTGGANTKATKKINESQMNTNEHKWIRVVEDAIG